MHKYVRPAYVLMGALLLLALLAVMLPAAQAEVKYEGVTYVVKPGDRIIDIAARYGVSSVAIMEANDLANADLIYPGQTLIIPGASSAEVERTATPVPTKAPTPSPTVTASPTATVDPAAQATALPAATGASGASQTYHTVALGETLDIIARQYNASASAIIRANGISNADLIYVGQKLLIPGAGDDGSSYQQASGGPKGSTTPPPPIKQTTHVVQPGDTLAQIALKYSVPVASLVAANQLGSADMIRVGQRLLIPGQGVTKYPGRATKFVASISQQRCWLYQGDTVTAEWVCSTGRPGSNTRPGTYKIQSKLPKAYGSTWDIWMPYWMGIYWAGASENGIHGLPWNAKTGVQVWTGFVGTPITYGCLMLDNVNAKMLYDMSYIGMPVVIQP